MSRVGITVCINREILRRTPSTYLLINLEPHGGWGKIYPTFGQLYLGCDSGQAITNEE